MDIKNIRLNILQVAVVIGQTMAIVWYFGKQAGELKEMSKTAERIEKNQEKEAADSKLRMSKMEVDISDLKVRIGVTEAKVRDLELRNFGR